MSLSVWTAENGKARSWGVLRKCHLADDAWHARSPRCRNRPSTSRSTIVLADAQFVQGAHRGHPGRVEGAESAWSAAEPSVPLSERAVHDVQPDVAVHRVPEALRERAEHREAE